jgi:hypothetical protein
MAKVIIDGVRYVPDPDRVTRMSLYYMYDNGTFESLSGTLDKIVEVAKKCHAKDPWGMLCQITLFNGEREIRRVGENLHGKGNATGFATCLDAWVENVLKDADVRRLFAAEAFAMRQEYTAQRP